MKKHAWHCRCSFCFSRHLGTSVNAQLVPIKVSYATTSGIRLPLWIAEEAKLYEKYGLDAKLINIPSGNTAISALVSGEVDIVSGSGSASIVAAGRGLPVVIVGRSAARLISSSPIRG